MVLTLRKFSDRLTKVMKVVMVVLFIWMVVSLGIQVGARYIFNQSFVWSEESARYCMIWMVFIGAAEILFNDDHIKVTVIEDLLRGQAKEVLMAVQNVIGLIFSILLAYYSFPQVALASKAVSSNMDINMGIVYAIFPVVTILMAVGYVFRLILLYADRPSKHLSDQGGDRT